MFGVCLFSHTVTTTMTSHVKARGLQKQTNYPEAPLRTNWLIESFCSVEQAWHSTNGPEVCTVVFPSVEVAARAPRSVNPSTAETKDSICSKILWGCLVYRKHTSRFDNLCLFLPRQREAVFFFFSIFDHCDNIYGPTLWCQITLGRPAA